MSTYPSVVASHGRVGRLGAGHARRRRRASSNACLTMRCRSARGVLIGTATTKNKFHRTAST